MRLIFPGWLPFGGIWQWDFVKPCPTTGGHPKGVGLEGIRGASYALTVPAKQNRVLYLSGTGNKLQVEVFPDDSFDGFGDLAVQPSFKPWQGSGVYDTNRCFGICYLYKSCPGKSCFCFFMR